jgi:aminocarboxymuconate-semialdehyde decarboxylase
VLAHGGGSLPSVLPRVAFGQRLVGGETVAANMATERARLLWCDSLTYDTASMELCLERFGTDHVVLGTDYPFAAREAPAGAVLDASEGRISVATRRAVVRSNFLALLEK